MQLISIGLVVHVIGLYNCEVTAMDVADPVAAACSGQ